MQRTCLFFILLTIGCLSIPSGAAAQYTLTKISGDGQTGNPGQTLKPFVVQISPATENIPVTFAPSHGPVSDLLVFTDANGRAQSTLTLGSRIGTATTTVKREQVGKGYWSNSLVYLAPNTLWVIRQFLAH